jgi:hypothetical protein
VPYRFVDAIAILAAKKQYLAFARLRLCSPADKQDRAEDYLNLFARSSE